MESLNFEQAICPVCHNPMRGNVCSVCAADEKFTEQRNTKQITDLLAEYRTRLIAVFGSEPSAQSEFDAFKARHSSELSGLEEDLDLYNDILWKEWQQPQEAQQDMERAIATAFNTTYLQRQLNQ